MKRLDGWSGKIFDGVDGDFSTEIPFQREMEHGII